MKERKTKSSKVQNLKVKSFVEVPVEELRWHPDPKMFNFNSTNDLKTLPDIIGQKRAVDALRLGLDIESLGYNIFVTGAIGTGRKTAVKHLLKDTDRMKRIPEDKLYVNNFKNPDTPRLIRLPAGQGRAFRKDMNSLVVYLAKTIPTVFESKEYQHGRKEIIELQQDKVKQVLKRFENEVAKCNFSLIKVLNGPYARPAILPVIDGTPVNFEQLSVMEREGKISSSLVDKLEKKHTELNDKLEVVFKEIRDIEMDAERKIASLNHKIVAPIVEHRVEEISKKYKNAKINDYLDSCKENILDNLSKFNRKQGGLTSGLTSEENQSASLSDTDSFIEYRVNLIVDNFGSKHAPVIFETSPNYRNLFGTIEATMDKTGYWKTDFTKIKAGSILQADGGFMIIEAMDALVEPGVWQTLKRTLRNQKIEIQNYVPYYMILTTGLKPESISCDVKVVMVGDMGIYHILYNYDEDFKKVFKIRADFDSVMPLNETSQIAYANFVKKVVHNENLIPFNKEAIMRVMEYGVEIAGRQDKLSTRFNTVADIMREANYLAHKEQKTEDKGQKTEDRGQKTSDHQTIRPSDNIVTELYVEQAIENRNERARMIEQKIQELIENGTIKIDTEGSVIGQVNGLAVYDTGEYSFGKPSRITAKVGVGNSGIVDIEREAELSGPIHRKGVLILSGYLRDKYAQDMPIVMSASICFEQSYSGVEGDSASSTELYALLSALSGLPIRQEIAVTGAVNQKGEIQAIGGVNEKIEGFFKTCKVKGLTGTQGVIIPHQNINDLMLSSEVVHAVKQGKFHIYPVSSIDEGIEILTDEGMSAGDEVILRRNVHALVSKRLQEFAQKWREARADK
ncbi:MAG: AAA family ATPase [Candidatus Stahlbacteria bacterium]|nr:AAA family ATPase [Candidatus Stahlbacteria bacterium]